MHKLKFYVMAGLSMWALSSATGCGGGPKIQPFSEQYTEAQDDRKLDPGAAGWWRYLSGDLEEAKKAFAAGEGPLQMLGRARLALDALDYPGALAASEAVLKGERSQGTGSAVHALAGLWARRALAQLPAGHEKKSVGGITSVPITRDTLRISFLPFLDFRRLAKDGVLLDGDTVQALGKRWALKKGQARPDRDGIVLSEIALEKGPAHLEISVDGPMMAWRDGALVASDPAGRFPAGVRRLTAPGNGPLIVAWAAPRVPEIWRWPHPAPLPTGSSWLDKAFAIQRALVDEDPAEVARLLEGAPDTPAFEGWRAEASEQDPSRSGRRRRDAARVHWQAARSLMGPRADLALARLDIEGGDQAAALRRVKSVIKAAPEAHRPRRLKFELLLALGDRAGARQALPKALGTAPDPCALVADRVTLAEQEGSPEARLPLVEQLTRCGKPMQAVKQLMALERHQEALARLVALAAEKPKDAGIRRARARCLVALGRLEEAARLYKAGSSAGDALALADLEVPIELSGGPYPSAVFPPSDWPDTALSNALKALIQAHPKARQAIEIVRARPDWSPFAEIALDTEAVIAAYEKSVPLPGPAVRLLDHSALLIFKDGKSLRWVHEVLAIRSREAAEYYGELGLPEGSELLSLYTRKADGQILYAEDTPEKDTTSLPDLDEGDYVVAVYLEPGDNGYIYNHGFLTPRMYFQGVDMPIFLQRFEVFPPTGGKFDVQRLGLDDDHLGPKGEPARLGKIKGLRFEALNTLRLPQEGNEVPAGLWLPSIRVGWNVKLSEDLDYLRDRLLARRRRTLAFDSWVKAALEAQEDDGFMPRFRALVRKVRADVAESTGMTDHDVDRMRITGRGNRAAVLSAALETLDVPHRVLLARPQIHVPSGPFRQVADFVYPLIEVLPHASSALSETGIKSPIWLDPAPDRAPVGFVPFIMLGGEALQAWPPAVSRAPVSLPKTRTVADSRRLDVKMKWAADGSLTGEVVDVLEGQEAIVIGEYFNRLTPEERPRLVERLLVGAVGAATVTSLEDPLAGPSDGPLVLKYTFKAEAPGDLNLGLFPNTPARSYASLAERKIPMAVELPTDQRLKLTLTSEVPMTAKARAGTWSESGHSYRVKVDAGDTRLIVESHMQIEGGQISPEGYPKFAEWTRKVEAAERVMVKRSQPVAQHSGR
ncbi:MAG: tetratricopeptide repeat protein [Bradymonadia bacterium]